MVYRKSKDNVTTTIDPYLKQAFEVIKDDIGKSYRDLLEEGIEKLLLSVDPVDHLKHKLKQRALEDDEMRQQISKLEILHPQQRQMTQYGDKGAELEKHREELFQKDFETLQKLWGDSDFYTVKLIERYEFKNRSEAREWFRPRMIKQG